MTNTRRRHPRQSQGFTLLEVLVAVAISATVGVAAVQLLSNISQVNKTSIVKADDLGALQRFNQILGRDIGQYITRSIRDEYGDEIPSLMLGSGDYPLEMTIAGWRNSPVTEDPRSTLQRIAYRTEDIQSEPCEPALERLAYEQGLDINDVDVEGECFVRYYWTALDRGDVSEPSAQVLYDLIEEVRFEVVVSTPSATGAPELNTVDYWPPVSDIEDARPVALRVHFTAPGYGDIMRQWPITHD